MSLSQSDPLSNQVIGLAIKIHKVLGPGLLESVEKLLPIHEAHILTYLRLSGCRAGLLMNFNQVSLRDGLKRFVL